MSLVHKNLGRSHILVSTVNIFLCCIDQKENTKTLIYVHKYNKVNYFFLFGSSNRENVEHGSIGSAC